jgi:hypothetical protein
MWISRTDPHSPSGNIYGALPNDRWIKENSNRPFAHPTEVEALKSFAYRKSYQIAHLQKAMNKISTTLWYARNVLSAEKITIPTIDFGSHKIPNNVIDVFI